MGILGCPNKESGGGGGVKTEDKGVKEVYTELKGNMHHQSSIKRTKSIMQTRIDLPKVRIFLEKHFPCSIELSVCTSVKEKIIITKTIINLYDMAFSMPHFCCSESTLQFKCPEWDSVFPVERKGCTSGLCHGVNEICPLLGFYAA
jgi:hypothetical protein